MWLYQGNKIESLEDIEKIHGSIPYGFLYNIVGANGREYIGRKNLRIKNSRVIGKRELEKHPDKRTLRKYKSKKGKKKGQWIYYEERYKENNWLEYTGSNDMLNRDIDNGMEVTKYILEFVDDEKMMSYKEMRQIVCTGALEDERFYNDHVDKRYFKKNILKNI